MLVTIRGGAGAVYQGFIHAAGSFSRGTFKFDMLYAHCLRVESVDPGNQLRSLDHPARTRFAGVAVGGQSRG